MYNINGALIEAVVLGWQRRT